MMQRILAVDDNEDILEVLQLILEDSGYEVETLTNGHLLFDKIKAHRPDLILLDIMLGNMDGRELCKNVKAKMETNNIPVILISASHNLSDRYKPCDAPNDFLAKPFDISELLEKVHTNLSAA
ncbi:MAG TPA: response regulator [Mucilaginibacter sp.]|nr:response regulator [Mucilaginibacter sp.]